MKRFCKRMMFAGILTILLQEALGGIEGNVVEDRMGILRLGTGMAQHQLTHTRIALGQLGAHKASQVVRFDASQPEGRGWNGC